MRTLRNVKRGSANQIFESTYSFDKINNVRTSFLNRRDVCNITV